ncbi:MAG TPA: hypothetical protein VK766_07575 [Cytophagaceae bacterium]|jgi:predicted metalloprotease with PDZ domain|nr:hypothetical protein [Cytophagaceae bacterium]
MTHYSISYTNPLTHLVTIEILIKNINSSSLEFQLPAWRPGRYELQNYAANIKNFSVADQNGKRLSFAKTSRNKWKIEPNNSNIITLTYDYYAHQMDAGGCWLDEEQLYLNFICCLLYLPEKITDPCFVKLDLPSNYKIACGLPQENQLLAAENFYHLVDSPMIASPTLTYFSFDCENIPFHLWIQGNNPLSPEKIIADFKKFTELQIAMMENFPEKEYHYLFQFLPYPHYHGVEHRNSTVITLGSSENLAEKRYEDLIGISSHELFHTWNIVKIRPKELWPYDFTKENYFPTGFVAEGFTTYYGDLFLVRSGVISVEEYFTELNTTFKKHFNHFGNQNLSLVESSLDLWVDGYVAGIPDRKVSIYVKGCVAALILDLEIRLKTNHLKSLDDLMRLLWNRFGKKKIGYSLEDISIAAEEVTGIPLNDFFEECIFGHTDMKERLSNLVKDVACILQEIPAPTTSERCFGLQILAKENRYYVESIAPNSPASYSFSKGDELLQLNGSNIQGNFDEALYIRTQNNFTLKRFGRIVQISILGEENGNYFPQHQLVFNENSDEKKIGHFKKWLHLI